MEQYDDGTSPSGLSYKLGVYAELINSQGLDSLEAQRILDDNPDNKDLHSCAKVARRLRRRLDEFVS